MFTNIRPITVHCILAALALAACADSPGGGGPCSAPGSMGSLAFTFPSGSFTASCFSAASDGGSVTFTSLSPPSGQTAAVLQLTLEARDQVRQVCPWFPGASAALVSSFVDMTVQARNGDAVLATAAAGLSAPAAPAPAGAVTASDWSTGPGQLVSVFFTAGAAAVATGGPDGGALVPVSGSATTLIDP